MGDLSPDKRTTPVEIFDEQSGYSPSVILEDGLRKLAVSKLVQVDSLSGRQQSATNNFSITNVAAGDTLRIEIDATDQSPALDKTFTVQVGEDKFTFIARVELELNQDFVNFQPYFRAIQVDDNAILFILAKAIGEAGSNENQNSFRVTTTGTVVATAAFDNFIPRTSVVQASLSTSDPRLAVFGIEGTVESRDASVEGLFIQKPFNAVASAVDLNVDGSVTPKVFTFPMNSIFDYFISEIKFFGRDNGIQFGNRFLGNNTPLANGILLEIKTDNNLIELPPIKTTDDFDDVFSFGGSNFDVYFASGADKFTARFLTSAFPLRRSGTFGVGNDDFLRITIRDNLTSIGYFQAIAAGFRQEA